MGNRNSGVPKGTNKGRKNPSKKGIAPAQTKSAVEKSALTRSVTTPRRLTPEVQKYIKDALTEPDKNGKSFYEKFIQTFLKEALADPNSRAGVTLASSMFSETLLDKLDQEANKAMAKDMEFMRYRLRSTLFDKQQQVYDDAINQQIEVICSRRAGKTELNARLLLKACVTPDTPCLYVNTTFTNAINQMFDNVLKLATDVDFPVMHSSRAEGYIEFANKSIIYFRGNSNSTEADKVRGYKYKLVIVDEVGHQRWLNYLIYYCVLPATKDFADSQIIYTGTPNRVPHQFAELLFDNPNVKKYHWTFKDNPYIPNKENVIPDFAKAKGIEVNDTLIQRELLGIMKCYDTEAQVFRGAKNYKEIPSNFLPTNVYIGVDFGFNDFNGVVTLVVDKLLKVGYVFKNEKKFNKSDVSGICTTIKNVREEVLEWCHSKNPSFNDVSCQIITDTNEKSITYELTTTYGLPNVFCAYKYDRDTAIAQLAEWMRKGIINIPEDGFCEEEVEQTVYKRDPDTDVVLNEIDDDLFHPDILMALLYCSRQFAYDILRMTEDHKSATPINPTVNPGYYPDKPKQENNTDFFDDVNWD